MMKRTVFAALLLTLSAASALAQDVLEQINTIKLDPQYVYGEATHEKEDSAFLEALYDLQANLESRLKQRIDMSYVEKNAKKLSRPRGQKVRVMAYVKVDEVPAAATAAAPKIKFTPQTEQTTEQPVTQTVTTPEPQPVTVPEPQPVTTPEPQPVTVTEPQPATQSTSVAATDSRLTKLTADLMAAGSLQSLSNVLDAGKRSGTISIWAPYKKTAQPEGMYLLIYDREYNTPIAVLSPQKANGMRDNLTTGKEDTLDNYKEKLAVCFSLTQK